MNPTNQAFVKTFSRRHQTDAATPTNSASPTDPELSSDADADQGLQVNPKIADSASMWIDSGVSDIKRVDSRQDEVSRPHIADRDLSASASVTIGETTVDERLALLQQVHTAYAAGSLAAGSLAYEATPVQPATTPEIPARPDSPQRPDAPAQPLVETRIDPPTTEPPSPKPGIGGDHSVHDRGSVNQAGTANDPASAATAPESSPAAPSGTSREDATANTATTTFASGAEEFRAAWEVDVFDLPNTVADLFFEGQLFQQIAERMLDAVTAGLSSMLVTSIDRGEGRSSVAIGMSMAAAAAGLRVALVDGDLHSPTLCDDLRLDLDQGWIDSVRGRLPLKEVAVQAIEDGVTLIPLKPATSMKGVASALDVAELLDLLHQRFDLVIVDGPAATSTDIAEIGAGFDSAVIVRDTHRTTAAEIRFLTNRLADAGVRGIGLVENFS